MNSRKILKRFTNQESIEKTIERLINESYLSKERGEVLKKSLPDMIRKSEYVLYNLAVHTAIGTIFAFDLIPIPLGSISRFNWVLGNRIYHTVKDNKEKKQVHSYKVLAVSAIPFVGYLAYTIPLKKISEYLCYVYANHIIYNRKNESLESYLNRKPKLVRAPLKKFLIPEDLRKK